MKPLENTRVLDLTRVLAGPYCTMILADLGAHVIKVEMPGSGDDTRQWGPPFQNGESAYFLSINRNKKSLALNLKRPRGREVFLKLINSSDVLVENFRPGTMESLGLGYETLRASNPGLVYCSISGFGQTGPYNQRPGYDLLMQGMGGLMSITGEEGGPPLKVGIAITDIGAGMWGALGIMAALNHRQRTGQGQLVDVALLDGVVSWLTFMAGIYFATGQNPPKLGSAHPTIVPYQAFQCSDGRWIVVAVGNDNLWLQFLTVIRDEAIASDPRFARNQGRVENRKELVERLERAFLQRDAAYWLLALEAAGVPVGPINTLEDVFRDPQVLARDMLAEMDHPLVGRLNTLGVPVKLSLTPGSLDTPPPLLGEHTREILMGLGYSPEEVEEIQGEATV
jgi:formyl-CoA transferase/CoA:oxalate CoA-transferase